MGFYAASSGNHSDVSGQTIGPIFKVQDRLSPKRRQGMTTTCCVITQKSEVLIYRGADKSLARPGRKQTQNHVREARFQQHRAASCHQGFFFFLQGKAPKEIHAILTETLACFLPGRSKDLSASMYVGDIRS